MKFNEEGVPSFISRRQSVHGHYPDRTEKLPQFHDIKLPEYAGHIVPIELIHSGWIKGSVESHAGVSGILNSLQCKAIADQASRGPVRAVLLDVLNPKIPTYAKKLDYLKTLEQKVGKPDVLFAPDVKITKDDIQDLIHTTKQEGREGVIITDLHMPEEINPRIKIKHFGTYNLKISGIQQEVDINGNPKNSMGAVHVVDGSGREVATVGTGWSKEERERIWKTWPADLGKMIQVKAFPSQAHRLRGPVYNGEGESTIDTI
jgi:hypothetical protein